MKKTIAFLALVAGLLVLGACTGATTAPVAPGDEAVAESAAAARPEVVVYLSPT
jgi:hypothetical protein